MIPLGLDWLAIGLALIALLRIGGGHRDGFIAFMGSNLTWILAAFLIGNPAIALGNTIFLFATCGRTLSGNDARSKPLKPRRPPDKRKAHRSGKAVG
jgi:hypothetical protein